MQAAKFSTSHNSQQQQTKLFQANINLSDWPWTKEFKSRNIILTMECSLRTRSHQKLTFSGVGAHNQNGVAEWNIKTISQWARANMLHAAYHWPEHANIKLWPQAVDYAVWVFNCLPSLETGLSPNEIWSQSHCSSHDIRCTHPFGCPVYVLDPALQDGGKIVPKWDTRARRGMFVGFSDKHSSLVPLCLNINTGKISSQYHVILDERFETVTSLPKGQSLHDQWLSILEFQQDHFIDDNKDTQHLPQDFIEWFERDENENLPEVTTPESSINIEPTDTIIEIELVDPSLWKLMKLFDKFDSPNTPNNDRKVPEGDTQHKSSSQPTKIITHDKPTPSSPCAVTEGEDITTEGEGAELTSLNEQRANRTNPPRNVGSYKDGPAIIRRLPIIGEDYDYSFSATQSFCTPVATIAQRGLTTLQPHPQKIHKYKLLEYPYLQDEWSSTKNNLPCYLLQDPDNSSCIDAIQDPRVTAAKISSSKYNDNNPLFDMAVNSPFQAEYWEAMRLELETLATDFRCWELVPREPHMNVLPSTWAFKVKRYPDGSVKKFKARFCARGDKQLEGIDYFETWAPVVQWSTIRVVMIIAAKLGYYSAQCDITAAFIHAHLPDREHIYVEQPRGFSKKSNHVLRLNRSLYGLKQAPRHFFHYLSDRLVRNGLTQSQYDPYLFMNASMIVIVYVDDLLIYAKDSNLIDNLIEQMKREEVCLHREGTAEGYLGVNIKHENGQIHLMQSGLTQRILDALGLHKYSNSSLTPAEVAPLPKDVNGERAAGTINYASVVGMLLYLSGHSRPDIAFAVHQCARYTFAPTKRHEQALIRIGQYLKGTVEKGLIMTPSKDLRIDCYPDADFAGLWGHEDNQHPHCVKSRTGFVITLANANFAGLWGHEDNQDPHCVKSRTGFVITLANCPVVWASKMQTEIALSTMEAEYIALSTACRDLFPIMDKIAELSLVLGIDFHQGSNMHVRIHEDNAGTLVLGKLEPRRMTPRSKHYAVKYHWFRERLSPRNIELVKIPTQEQLGDIFTKGLGSVAFQRVQKQLMGW